MDILERFLAYAGDFERTLLDDDWTRLAPYFADDAVYEVDGGDRRWRMEGATAILAGLRKSLDGFDRRFDSRDAVPNGPPTIGADTLRLDWTVTYHKAGVPDFVLAGKSAARYRDGRIVELRDAFAPGTVEAMAAWHERTGIALDPSYT